MPSGEATAAWSIVGAGTQIKLDMRGFEIKTIRLVL